MVFNQKCLNDILKQTPLTQELLAERLGVKLSTIQSWCQGKVCPPLERVVAMADYFALPLDIFIGRCTEDQYNAIMDSYNKQFMQLRRAPYTAYILQKRVSSGNVIEFNVDSNLKIEAPWPNNLIDHVFGENVDILLDVDHIAGLELAINSLSEREQKAVHLYFEDGYTLDGVGREFGVHRERARQVLAKALRKMRHPSRSNPIKYGVEGNKQRLEVQNLEQQIQKKKTEYDKLVELTDELYAKIEELNAEHEKSIDIFKDAKYREAIMGADPRHICSMDLSVRAFNCLMRSNLITVYDIIARFKEGNVHRIRNFGKKSCQEVLDVLHNRFGVDMTFEEVW